MARHTHKLVRDVAEEMAGVFYDTCAHDDFFYRQFPNEKAYIRKKWGAFVGQARATLAQMLDGPSDVILKDQIYEALLKDSALQGGDIQEIIDRA